MISHSTLQPKQLPNCTSRTSLYCSVHIRIISWG